MCLNETYTRVRIGKHLSDMFPIKNGLKQECASSPLLFNFALEYANRRIQVYQDGLKLNGTHQLLVYASDVNILGRSIHTIKKNTGAFTVASEENEVKVNADKTKYVVMSRIRMQGEVITLKLIIATLKGNNLNESKFHSGRIKIRIKSGNDCLQSVQNLLSSNFFIQKYKD